MLLRWSAPGLLLLAVAAAASPAPAASTATAAISSSMAKKDLDSSAAASGYIYRKDGNKPAVFFKLGAGQGVEHGAERLLFDGPRQPQPRVHKPLYSGRLGQGSPLDTVEHSFGSSSVPVSGLGHRPGTEFTSGFEAAHQDAASFGPDHRGIQEVTGELGGGLGVRGAEEGGVGLAGLGGFDDRLGDSPSGLHGPIHGLGDAAEDYLSGIPAAVKAARDVHLGRGHGAGSKQQQARAHEDHGSAFRGEDFSALKAVGEEYSPAFKVDLSDHDDLTEQVDVGGHGGGEADIHGTEPKVLEDYHHGHGGHGGGGGGGGGHGTGFSAGGGSKHSGDSYSSHGTKAGKGHKSTKTYGAGESGSHGSDSHKGSFAKASGAKKVHQDEASKYGDHHTTSKGGGGAKHGEKGHGKKGHKSTGYHNVYNKDEFKKDTSFYDSNSKGGHHHKGGDYSASHGGKSGAHKKGGHHGSAYDEGHKGKKSHVDKGKETDDHKANKGSSGHEAKYGHKEEYGKKDGASSGKKYAHKSGGGGHH